MTSTNTSRRAATPFDTSRRAATPFDTSRRAATLVAHVAVLALGLGACGSGSDGAAPAAAPTTLAGPIESVAADRVLAGAVREPAPQVDGTALPSLSHEGDATFRASPDHVKVVYFGYTNCPDICPTTLYDLALGLQKVAPELAARVEVLMVTVDPNRDTVMIDTDEGEAVLLDRYVKSFVPTAEAAGTTDTGLLDAAGAPFGIAYKVEVDEASGEYLVEHSTQLYVVDDAGRLALIWQFGQGSDDIAGDLVQLLTRGA